MKREVKRKLKIQRPPILTAKTQKLVAAVQKELDLPLLVYWVSTGGSICQKRRDCHVAIARTDKEGG